MRKLVRVLAVLALALGVMRGAVAEDYSYSGSGAYVTRDQTQGTATDDGVVICDSTGGGNNVGGACIPFTSGVNSISVDDDMEEDEVAFQVCIDNDGDRSCGNTPPIVTGCGDVIAYSHFDSGAFSNPLAVPASGFANGCPGGYPGWIVIACTGAHRTTLDPDGHPHPVTTGTISTSTDTGGSSGQFCAPPFNRGKPYRFNPPTENICIVAGQVHRDAPLNLLPSESSYHFLQTTMDCTGPELGGTYSVTADGTDTGVAGGATCPEGHERLTGSFEANKTGPPSLGPNSGPAVVTGTVLHARSYSDLQVQGTFTGDNKTGIWSGNLLASASGGSALACATTLGPGGITDADLNGAVKVQVLVDV